jgi:hypothetical protein
MSVLPVGIGLYAVLRIFVQAISVHNYPSQRAKHEFIL